MRVSLCSHVDAICLFSFPFSVCTHITFVQRKMACQISAVFNYIYPGEKFPNDLSFFSDITVAQSEAEWVGGSHNEISFARISLELFTSKKGKVSLILVLTNHFARTLLWIPHNILPEPSLASRHPCLVSFLALCSTYVSRRTLFLSFCLISLGLFFL